MHVKVYRKVSLFLRVAYFDGGASAGALQVNVYC